MNQPPDNPYAPPTSSLTPAMQVYSEKTMVRKKYSLTFLSCMLIPIPAGALIILVFELFEENGSPQIALASLLFGWMVSIPFAAIMTLAVYFLRLIKFKFTLKNNLLTLPALFTLLWLGIMLLLEPPAKVYLHMLILMGVPALLSGIRCAFVWQPTLSDNKQPG